MRGASFVWLAAALAVIQPEAAAAQAAPPAAQPSTLAAAELRINQARAAFVDSYRAGNLDALMTAYHRDATFAGTLQPFWIKGADGIRDLWSRYFAAWPQRQLIFRDTETRFYGDTTAVETGYLEMYMARPETREFVPTFIRYSITRVREGDNWLIVNMNVAPLPGTSK